MGVEDGEMTPIESRFLALSLLHRHHLFDWTFILTKTKRVCGRCWIPEKVIGLSQPVAAVNSAETVEQILLHEIAHALTGRREHDQEWREVAKRIGCRVLGPAVAINPVPGKWRFWCGDCRTVFYMYRRPRREMECGRGHRLEVMA